MLSSKVYVLLLIYWFDSTIIAFEKRLMPSVRHIKQLQVKGLNLAILLKITLIIAGFTNVTHAHDNKVKVG